MASFTVVPTPSFASTDPKSLSQSEPVEHYSYDDVIVRRFVAATVVWALVATVVGLLVAVLLVMPKLLEPLGWPSQWLTFGRLRPLHTNAAIFAFAGNGIFAAIYYSTQRLCKAR